MGLFIVSSVLSLVLIWVTCALARSEYWGPAGACLFAALATIPFLFCFFPALALQSLLTFVFLCVCLVGRVKPSAIKWVAIGAMVVSYGILLSASLPKLIEFSKLRSEFPLQSVSDRLAYEAKATEKLAGAASRSEPAVLRSEVAQRLEIAEQRVAGMSDHPWRGNRRSMLASLHNRKSDEFAVAQGFGPTRMMPGFVSTEDVELPEVEPVPMPTELDRPYEPDQGSSDALADIDRPTHQQPPTKDLLSLHESGVFDFVDPNRIGYVRDRDHVAGFQSHQFTKMPELAVEKDQPSASWQVARLELVSLLKHEVPVAYVSKNLPQMDELREAPTRPLEAFERQSLDRLRSDEDVVIDETPDRIRMIGSLRAARNCLECHSVRRGELLGALTYELVPVRPSRKQQSPEAAIN